MLHPDRGAVCSGGQSTVLKEPAGQNSVLAIKPELAFLELMLLMPHALPLSPPSWAARPGERRLWSGRPSDSDGDGSVV